MEKKLRLQAFKKVEVEINRHLFFICSAVTIIVMAIMVTEFFCRGMFPAVKMSLFYLGVLLLYSLHKELVRWMGKKEVDRQGEYFVYSWIGLTTLLYIINFLSKDIFNYSPEGMPLATLREMSILTVEVLGIFIFTRCLKILKSFLEK